MSHPRFLISTGAGGEFTFNLTAPNGEIILASQRYSSRASAEGGAEAVKTNAQSERRYERRVARDKQHYFVLTAANGLVIGTSEMYASKPAMEGGIASVMNHAPNAPVR